MRNATRLLLAWATLLGSAMPALAEVRTVYQGTLGTSEVVLEVNASGGGRYFYRRHGVDIPLSGPVSTLVEAIPIQGDAMYRAAQGGNAPLFEDAQTRQPGPTWRGQVAGNTFTGSWSDGAGKKNVAFELRQVRQYDPDKRPGTTEPVTRAIPPGNATGVVSDAPVSIETAPYDYLKLQTPLKQGAEHVSGLMAWRMVIDPRTRFSYPRLTRHPDARVVEKVNALLARRHGQLNLAALECKATLYTETHPAAGSLGNYDAESVRVTFLSPTLMSIVESGSTDCGGAHPHNHYAPYTLDLVRGEYLDFHRLFRAFTQTPEGFAPSKTLMALIGKKLKAEGRGPESAAAADPQQYAGCDEVWPEYLALHFERSRERDALAVAVSGVPHALGACLGTTVALPFTELKPLLRPAAGAYLFPKP
ncbi:hypothetical protein CLU95_1309 [Variovorax sp. 54]|uniref:hypothetical protein n=1 Tax=Variovorax sp. 54 TaxID=2035212 RepID=UPI000C59CA63|nr:hypothetical protein [Variovorax sp. 54]PIF74188.1 hypothetical protein CLU95_1309 [Variovorax sp. 54]